MNCYILKSSFKLSVNSKNNDNKKNFLKGSEEKLL